MKKSLLVTSLLLAIGLASCDKAPAASSTPVEEGPKKAQVIVMSGQSNMEGSTLWGEKGHGHDDDDNWLEKAFEELGTEYDASDYIEGNVPEIQMSFRCFYPYESPIKVNASNMDDPMAGEFKNIQVGMANQTRFIGPEIGLANILREKASEETPIFFIKSAYGGSSLHAQYGTGSEYIWRTAEDGDGTEGKLWTETKEFVHNNLQLIEDMGFVPEVKAWLWHQGESDANDAGQAGKEQYGKYMRDLLAEFRDEFSEYAPEEDGENIAFVDCTIYDGNRITYSQVATLNQTKKSIAEEKENNYLINGSVKESENGLNLQIGGNSDLDGGFNKYHYITKDCIRLGEAYGNILVDNNIIE